MGLRKHLLSKKVFLCFKKVFEGRKDSKKPLESLRTCFLATLVSVPSPLLCSPRLQNPENWSRKKLCTRPPRFGQKSLLRERGGGAYFEVPLGRIFTTPPLLLSAAISTAYG